MSLGNGPSNKRDFVHFLGVVFLVKKAPLKHILNSKQSEP
jgi:hypothetical protein